MLPPQVADSDNFREATFPGVDLCVRPRRRRRPGGFAGLLFKNDVLSLPLWSRRSPDQSANSISAVNQRFRRGWVGGGVLLAEEESVCGRQQGADVADERKAFH